MLVPDLAGDSARWLGFAPDAVAAGAAAVFSLPLQIGAARLGTLDLHRDTAGALSPSQLADALVLAGLATETLLELLDPAAAAKPPRRPGDQPGVPAAAVGWGRWGWLPSAHGEVHVASGMVSAREGIGVGEALLRVRGYAFARGQPIAAVARRIIDRDLVLQDPQPDEPDTSSRGGPDHRPAGL